MSDDAARCYDLLVVGSGPAGQSAAVHAAKHGLRVALCEQARYVGGACVHQGTIPSKALRERTLRRLTGSDGTHSGPLDQSVPVTELIGEVGEVVRAHDGYLRDQLRRSGVQLLHGRASFESANRVQIRGVEGTRQSVEAASFVIATGSAPRALPRVAVDHEHVYDSDSILSIAYLPRTLTVLGGGVVACEYASIFALLGVAVTLVDRSPRPLGFLDAGLTEAFLSRFAALGGTFVGGATVEEVRFDGLASVITRLDCGTALVSDKVLCALGREARLHGLRVDVPGVRVTERGLIDVNDHGQTSVPHIYAAGDVVGPPALASASMEQGRRAACHLCGVEPGTGSRYIPTGIYTFPELASVGMTVSEARAAFSSVVSGVAPFSEIARGHIAGAQEGYLELVVSGDRRLRGVHIAGGNATELIHVGQMALIQEATLDVFIDNVFNFPTYGESYRVAALHAAEALNPGSVAATG